MLLQVNGFPWTVGAIHFQEIAFVFYNLDGLGYPQNMLPNPLGGVERAKYLRLAQLMVRMWISFVNFGDPNQQLGGTFAQPGPVTSCADGDDDVVDAEKWPVYTTADHQNYVFEQNCTSHPEADYYRAPGMQYIADLIYARAGRNCSGIVACGS